MALGVGVSPGLASADASASDPVFQGTVQITVVNGDVTTMQFNGNLESPKTGDAVGNLIVNETTSASSTTPPGECTISFTADVSGVVNGNGFNTSSSSPATGSWKNGLKQVTTGTTTAGQNFKFIVTVPAAVGTTCGAGGSTVTGKFSIW
jgi:hypothetical protein